MNSILNQLCKTLQLPPLKVVKAIIIREDGKVLILRRSRFISFRRKNDLPGGVVDRGEDLHAALKREVHEETGLDVFGLYEVTTKHCMSLLGPIHMHVYACRAFGNIELSWEHDKYWWREPAEVIKTKGLPGQYKTSLNEYLNGHEELDLEL